MSNTGLDKAGIRALALRRRDALTAAERGEAGLKILNLILAMKEFREARTVLAYSGFGTEIDTRPLLLAAIEARQTLVLPRVNRGAGVLDLYEVRDIDTDLCAGPFGIHEPDPARCNAARPEAIDWVLVPGVAFDRRGGRIGYGKGYYDKLLAGLRNTSRHPRKVAAAFDVQIVDAIPMEPHDVAVDAVVTEVHEWRCEPGMAFSSDDDSFETMGG